VLVNNAGLAAASPARSADGFELMMATNHLGPFLLTNLLLGKLGRSGSARIVGTASEAHRAGGPGAQDTRRSAGLRRARRAGGVRPLQADEHPVHRGTRPASGRPRRHRELLLPGPSGYRPHPGPAKAPADGHVPRQDPVRPPPRAGCADGPEAGARPGARRVSGQFYTSTPGARLLPSVATRNDARYQRELWDRSAELVGLPG
jgi:NAD(P)-dependent dehydrogenase (short-subunit alcohol dehydrogenase family)